MTGERAITRRAAIAGTCAAAAAATLGSAGLCAVEALAQGGPEQTAAPSSHVTGQLGFAVNVQRCINCGNCEEACRLWNRTQEGERSRRTISVQHDMYGREVYVSTSCMHCETPSCATVCPAGAISKGEGGIVSVDKNLCIGCKYCYQACPYGVPHYNAAGMDKCDFCTHADVPLGEAPRCVRACKTGALRYGTMDELLTKSKRARQLEGPTSPSCVLL